MKALSVCHGSFFFHHLAYNFVTKSYFFLLSSFVRPELMVKKLRYYARLIVVCLLLRKLDLVKELTKVSTRIQVTINLLSNSTKAWFFSILFDMEHVIQQEFVFRFISTRWKYFLRHISFFSPKIKEMQEFPEIVEKLWYLFQQQYFKPAGCKEPLKLYFKNSNKKNSFFLLWYLKK